MRISLSRGTSSTIAIAWLTVGCLAMGRPAAAFSPFVTYVEEATPYNASPLKVARAKCPGGYSVLGGAAYLTGAHGKAAVQAAFPTYDASIWRDVYIVKAAAAKGNTDSWSVTAGVYCTPSTSTQKQSAQTLFDSTPIKKVTVSCPYPMKVVGMGGEVSKQNYDNPTNDPVTIPGATDLVFQGFDVSPGQTSVTAYAIEEAAALDPDYDYTGDWKLAAFASCAYEAYFGGLELRTIEGDGGGKAHTVGVSCSAGKKLMGAGARIADAHMGQWFIDRFSRQNAFQQTVFANTSRSQLSQLNVHQKVSIQCVDK